MAVSQTLQKLRAEVKYDLSKSLLLIVFVFQTDMKV